MSRFFIHRPNLAWVVAIFITLAGLLALPSLPVAQYPDVAPPPPVEPPPKFPPKLPPP